MITTSKKADSAIAQVLKSFPDAMAAANENDLVNAKLLKRMPRAIYFDLGKFGTGIVYGVELSNAKEVLKALKDGDEISAKVVESENDDGYVELSLAGAEKQKSWQTVKELFEKGDEMTVRVIGANSGGLMADVGGLKAFLPVSQLSNEHYPRVSDGDKSKILAELRKFVGQDIKIKILDVNPRADKLILSEKEISNQGVRAKLAKYKAGDIIDGIISGVADFGAFIKFADEPEIEGLIHISELGHKLIENPKEIVKVNDQVKAKVLEIKDGRVTLSLKALKADPWETVAERYKEHTDVIGRVSRFNPFGAFIALDNDIQGLIHVSEFGSVEEMKKKMNEGESYTFYIESIKPTEKRIILKLKK